MTLFLVGLLLGLYAAFVEPARLTVTNWRVQTPKWTYDQPLKIAILTDAHAIWPWMTPARLQKIIDRTNALAPDIVVLLGDYVATHPFGVQLNPADGVAPYKKLTPRCGTYAVMGNHDRHPVSAWPDALEQTGIPVLNNRALPVTCDGQKFWVVGIDDIWWGQPDLGKALGEVKDDSPVLFLMHNPDSFPDIPAAVALSMAGHTHGGQVRLPFIGSLSFVVPSKFGNRYAYGHLQEDGKDLVVSSGLGMTGLPIRFLNPPEIALVTLGQ